MGKNKICSKCNEEKLMSEFYKDKRSKGGIYPSCKKCNFIYKQRYNQKNRDYYKKKQQEFYLTPKGQYNSYKQASKTRKHNFDLTFDEFMQFWNKPCYYCGSSIELIGLDRMNNSVGYVLHNVVPCCTFCNRMKYTHDAESFIKQCTKISENQQLKVE